jgi:hypothetical protein
LPTATDFAAFLAGPLALFGLAIRSRIIPQNELVCNPHFGISVWCG